MTAQQGILLGQSGKRSNVTESYGYFWMVGNTTFLNNYEKIRKLKLVANTEIGDARKK